MPRLAAEAAPIPEKKLKRDKAKFLKFSGVVLSLAVFAFASYALYWGFVYRLPRSEPVLLDLRVDKSHENPCNDRCFMICAGLANNPHGYPGHCYIIWDRCEPQRLQYTDSDGFVPGRVEDLIPSLYSDIRGLMADDALVGNMRNFDYVAVRLDRPLYDRARAVRHEYLKKPTFHTGVRDCVAYVDEIAQIAGLKTPPRQFVYPLDYLERLKRCNSSND